MGLKDVRRRLAEVAERARGLPSVPDPPETVELDYGDAAYLYDIARAIEEAPAGGEGGPAVLMSLDRAHQLDRAEMLLRDWREEESNGEETETEAK